MVSNDYEDELSPRDTLEFTGEAPPYDPRKPIEVASNGGGAVNDPSGTDTRPPILSGDNLA